MKRTKLWMAGFLALLPAGAAGDVVHASRWIQRLNVTSGQFLATASISPTMLVEYCGDADGCTITLKVSDGGSLVAKATRLYLNEADPLQWFCEDSPVAGSHRDADDAVDAVLSLWAGLANCGIGDYESGSDSAPGFTVGLVPGLGGAASCTMVIED